MEIGISGLAVGQSSGLGRLNRTFILALAGAAPSWTLHVYLREHGDVARLAEEAGERSSELPANIHLYFPPAGWRNRLLLEEFAIPRQFGRLRLDAYLGCDFTLPLRPVAKRELVVVPDLIPYTRPATVGWRARWLYRRGLKRSIRRGAVLLCISERTQSALNSVFPNLHCETHVVRPALSPRLIDLASRMRELDRPLQVHGSRHKAVAPGPFLLYVGANGPRKNVPLLVSLHRRLVLEGDYSGSLILAGGDGRFHTAPVRQGLALETGPPLEPRIAENTPAVYDLGVVEDTDLSRLYWHADLLVNLSVEEGFGYPVLEALVHGTPAFVTADSTMARIAPGGVTGSTLEPETCYRRLAATLNALPVLRREAAALPVEEYSLARLGRDLRDLAAGEQLAATLLETGTE